MILSNFITRRYNEDIIWQICSSRNKGLFLFILIKQNIQGEAEIKEFRASRDAFRPCSSMCAGCVTLSRYLTSLSLFPCL